MFNLYQIVTGAQGGQALDNLAQQFGISREQADQTVKALVPALSTAFMAKISHPGGMQEIAAALDDPDHKQSYADPGAAQASPAQEKGGDLVSSIFGSSAIVQEVVRQASNYTGVPEATIQQMLPVIISVVVGGVATAMHNQGLGGVLGQIAGGLGNLFGQAGGVPGQTGSGGFGGMFGTILGSVLGGQHGGAAGSSAPGQAPPEGQAHPGPQMPGYGLPPVVQAGMEALGKMFQPGVQSPPGHMQDLGDQISSILGGKRG